MDMEAGTESESPKSSNVPIQRVTHEKFIYV